MTKRSDREGTEVSDKPRDWLFWIFWPLFIVTVPLTAFWMTKKPVPQVAVPVPACDISTYHLITTSDLTMKTLDVTHVSSDVLDEDASIVNHYTIETLTAGDLIRKDQVQPISDLRLITNTVAIGILAAPDMILGGDLRAGDVIDLLLVPTETDVQSSSPSSVLFENILVLDVKPSLESQAADRELTDHRFVVVVALPLDRRLEFATRSVGAMLFITRKL